MRTAVRFSLPLLACLLVVKPAGAAVQPDPGNAAARACGLALLADPAGPLAVFDQAARLGSSHVAIASATMRPFGLDALTRTRLALAVRVPHGATLALGFETYGPETAQRTRLVAGLAVQRDAFEVGAAWSEIRRERAAADAERAGALDAGLAWTRGALAGAFAARALASGGAPGARPDPDWTLEFRADVGPARIHGALTHDLGGTRPGGGLAFAVGPARLRAGAFGPPWSGAVGVGVGARGFALAAVRTHHPELGAGDAFDAAVAW